MKIVFKYSGSYLRQVRVTWEDINKWKLGFYLYILKDFLRVKRC